MNGADEHGGGKAGVSDPVAVGVWDAFGEAVVTKPAQIMGRLPDGNGAGVRST
ncbi:hypothetical protein AB4Z38_18310 [Arthrobacter sp. 2RAF6]|uniref:hypothetical protein n=1 Tax=Arthrobacter sp. 2RAF6 TaxID=3233002 RepID=UPI003F914200